MPDYIIKMHGPYLDGTPGLVNRDVPECDVWAYVAVGYKLGYIPEAGGTGAKGDTGATGPAGLKGDKGDKGDPGDNGAPGQDGDDGSNGQAGATGSQGANGPQGPQGIKGDKGDTGSQGVKGDTGLTGSQGTQGETGATGSQGVKGDTGNAGQQGIQGIAGNPGSAGSQGIQGVQGNPGVDGVRTATTAFGYSTGAGGTVTQSTNKATAVTLHKLTGQITMAGAALAAAAVVSFTLTNNQIAAGDKIIPSHDGAGTFGVYLISARAAAGSATIAVRNTSAGSLSEAIVIGFAVIKAVTT